MDAAPQDLAPPATSQKPKPRRPRHVSFLLFKLRDEVIPADVLLRYERDRHYLLNLLEHARKKVYRGLITALEDYTQHETFEYVAAQDEYSKSIFVDFVFSALPDLALKYSPPVIWRPHEVQPNALTAFLSQEIELDDHTSEVSLLPTLVLRLHEFFPKQPDCLLALLYNEVLLFRVQIPQFQQLAQAMKQHCLQKKIAMPTLKHVFATYIHLHYRAAQECCARYFIKNHMLNACLRLRDKMDMNAFLYYLLAGYSLNANIKPNLEVYQNTKNTFQESLRKTYGTACGFSTERFSFYL
ncbi:ORF61 [Ranid herpesvirus 2]|uniref:ORF61 n=1 Tax=Ranid herpesvirus 2 TaxID=389214 RepID=Q14W45_9VIRU|nr:ORF61 [Ranid herpesvirus 2]ABG25650.1 ORF61 [Ranid herpesvirus 2]